MTNPREIAEKLCNKWDDAGPMRMSAIDEIALKQSVTAALESYGKERERAGYERAIEEAAKVKSSPKASEWDCPWYGEHAQEGWENGQARMSADIRALKKQDGGK